MILVMKEKEIDLFDLRDLVLGRTVYHPNSGFSKDPVVLNGIRLNRRMEGYDVQVELLYPDGKLQWTDITGMATIPEYSKKKEAMDYAFEVKQKLSKEEEVSETSIRTLAGIVVELTRDVLSAKAW